MATANRLDLLLSTTTTDKDDKNFEIFSLIWLEKDVNANENNRKTQQKLRKSINFIKTFDDVKKCEQWIGRRIQQSAEEKIILIVSDSYGCEIVPRIYELPQLVAIYVYCRGKMTNKKWLENYKQKSDELVTKISNDQNEREMLEAISSSSMSSFTSSVAAAASYSSFTDTKQNSSTELNGDFLWSQVCIEVLLRMKRRDNDREELINLCKQIYDGNKLELRNVEEFEQTYTPETAVWCDLYQQLKELYLMTSHLESITRVYRGQALPTHELDGIKSIIGQHLSLNSFLSTSLDREVALRFIPSIPTANKEKILFEIDIDPLVKNVKPYANISSYSYFQTEAEVLFMLGSIFKIQSITKQDDVSIINIRLESEYDAELKQLSDYMKHNLDETPSLVTLADLLLRMAEYDKALKCYERVLKELDDKDKNTVQAARCFTGIGRVANFVKKYDLSIEYHEKALMIDLSLPNNDYNVAETYNNLANAYKDRRDHQIALKYFYKSLEINKKINSDDNLEVARLYFNIGNTYQYQQNSPTLSSLDQSWTLFKYIYNKQYGSINDEQARRVIWEKNVEMIQKHNLEADLSMHTYTMKVNQFADLTLEEFVKKMNTLKINDQKRENKKFDIPSNIVLPSSVDWRTKGYVTPVKNQGPCGSCWAFSTTGSLEGQHAKKSKNLISLSEQQLVDCSTKYGNNGCEGGLIDPSFQYIKDNNGIDSEDSYPYEAKDSNCRFNIKNVVTNVTDFFDIKSQSEIDLQYALATVGPIAVAIDANHDSFRFYSSGVYSEASCSTTLLDFSLLAVGYDTTKDNLDYYILKNQWTTKWGNQGYVWMSRNKNNQCGIATMASYPLV
ncbi:unnamed protein product [Rotaria sp. Silwood1]|nr:unnamed protein product [Rotaria sp. Silwood1]